MKSILIFNTKYIETRTDDLLNFLQKEKAFNIFNNQMLSTDNIKMFDCSSNEFSVIYSNYNSLVASSIVDNKNNELKIALFTINELSSKEEGEEFEDLWSKIESRLTKKG